MLEHLQSEPQMDRSHNGQKLTDIIVLADAVPQLLHLVLRGPSVHALKFMPSLQIEEQQAPRAHAYVPHLHKLGSKPKCLPQLRNSALL